MAKSTDTVEIPAADHRQLLARLEALEHADRVRKAKDEEGHRSQVLDPDWDARQAEVQKTAAQRTQETADRRWGTTGSRWRVALVAVAEAEGANPPDISEWPAVTISANSQEEAEARWLRVCGVTRHKHRLEAVPAAAALSA